MSLLYTSSPDGIYRRRTASVSNYDAEFYGRARAFWADPRVGTRYYLLSGSRSTVHQAALYRGFMLGLPGFNPANPPNTSKHEWNDKLGARAMDIHPVEGKGGTFAELHAVAKEYGFHFPIPAEKWHAELDPKRGFIPPSPTDSVEEDEDMPKPNTQVAACLAPEGGVWVLTYDGGVANYHGAPFYGSYPGLPAKDRQGTRNFIDIQPAGPRNSDGYTVISDDRGNSYTFNPALWEQIRPR